LPRIIKSDPIIVFDLQQPVYRKKIISARKMPLFRAIKINGYCHYEFETKELIRGLAALVQKVEIIDLSN